MAIPTPATALPYHMPADYRQKGRNFHVSAVFRDEKEATIEPRFTFSPIFYLYRPPGNNCFPDSDQEKTGIAPLPSRLLE